jgi:hypothetical protein
MNLRIITWNISFNCNAEKIAKYLTKNISGHTIINLQEVLEPAHSKIVSILNPDGVAYSLELRKAGKFEGKNRRMGIATYVFGGELVNHELVARSTFPERTLYSTIGFGGKDISILNFHSLAGLDYKKAKSSNFASLADFIDGNYMDFFTCDANEPKVDSMNDDEIEFFDNKVNGGKASLLFGKDKAHSLNDALKIHIVNTGVVGHLSPLAVSHVISRRFKRRYDHIYCSEKWKIKDIQYPYEESIEASSDHSAVIGDFSLR